MALDAAAPAADPLEAILAAFRAGTALVEAAAAALATIPPLLKRLAATPGDAAPLAALDAAIERAGVGGDNLLGGAGGRPFVVFFVARQASGALGVQSIEIDRAALAIARARDRLAAAMRDGADVTEALAALGARVAEAASRLSIVKTRLDLQASFLGAVVDADAGSPLVRLDSHLNHAGAREMALATRRLLSRQSLNIANTNRKTLRTLFERHVAMD